MTTHKDTRRSLLAGLGTAAAAFVLGSRRARAQATAPAGAFQPERHPEDAWMDALPGKHRTVIDCAGATSAGTGIFYANNIFTANRNAYRLADSDVAVIVILRHEATTYAYNDAIWAKYGTALAGMLPNDDPQASEAPTANPVTRTASGIAGRGAHFGICDMATNRIAGVVANAVGANRQEIYEELVSNLLPNGHMVAAGVVAINRAQEYGYSMLTAV
jgi:hypothetical protein